MPDPLPAICVCVCTFRRPELLRKLLLALDQLDTQGAFCFSAVVVDNDAKESARSTCEATAREVHYQVRYFMEPRQNIALARNKAMANAEGDYVAFIDDDECPQPDWLLVMFRACATYAVTGVLAPVRPTYEQPPPAWILRGGFFERPEFPTGRPLHWRETRTGNALVKLSAIRELNPPFRSQFGNGGEDQDFFRQLVEKGHRFVWCNEAPVYELVPTERMQRSYMFRRALLRGQNEKHMLSFRSVAKSIVASVVYAIMIPFLPLFGQHLFVKYLIKFFDHFGKLCAVVGIKPMGKKYLNT